MNILLDTHLVVWAINDDRMLTDKARRIILDPENELFFSAATVIEIDWKIRSKKNNLDFTVDEFIQMCRESQFKPTPLKSEHVAATTHLVWDSDSPEHKDPFDRMLLAQAMTEGMKFMTHDDKITMFRQDCVILV